MARIDEAHRDTGSHDSVSVDGHIKRIPFEIGPEIAQDLPNLVRLVGEEGMRNDLPCCHTRDVTPTQIVRNGTSFGARSLLFEVLRDRVRSVRTWAFREWRMAGNGSTADLLLTNSRL